MIVSIIKCKEVFPSELKLKIALCHTRLLHTKSNLTDNHGSILYYVLDIEHLKSELLIKYKIKDLCFF